MATPSGAYTNLYSFAGGTGDGATPIGGLIQASDGNFYGVTYRGGANGDGTLFQVTPNGTETVLHSFSGADGNEPYGNLLQGSDGGLYGVTAGGGAYGSGVGDGVVFVLN